MKVLRAWTWTASIAFRAWPAGALARLALSLVLLVSTGLLPGLALRAVLDGGSGIWMGVLAASSVVPLAAGSFGDWLQRKLMLRTDQATTRAVMAAALAPAGIEHLESPGYADAMEVVRANTRTPALLFDWLATAAGTLIGVVASIVVLADVHPFLIWPVAGAAVLGGAHAATRRRALVYLDQTLPGQRLTRRLAELATTPAPAKEVRILGLGSWLVDRHRAETDAVARRLVAGERAPVLAAAAGGLGQAIVLGVGILWLVHLARTGRVSTGDLALGLVVLRAATDQAGTMGMTIGSDLVRNTHVASHYLRLLDYQPQLVQSKNPSPVPTHLCLGIRLEGVTFRYEGSSLPALQDVSLTFPAGATVAIVGDNGSGKSTLVKLLCRFYDPQCGNITVDDIDLRDIDLDGWRQATAVTLQDFVRFRFLGREAIGVGDSRAIDDDGRVIAAAVAGGAHSFMSSLPSGYATQLGREFTRGWELSEGQWQKVALSRAFMPRTPLLFVLDEPTASLDARAEHEIFERYTSKAPATLGLGGVTVLVSHRFSTVRVADIIVVLHDGRVMEVGSHKKLLDAGGYYADMFALQSDGYR